MRKLITLIALVLCISVDAQEIGCPEDGKSVSEDGPLFKVSLINDGGFISSKPFINVSFQLGVWTRYVGISAGYTEYKPKDTVNLIRGEVFTLAFRDKILDDKITISPHISYNTMKRLDYGIRILYSANEMVDIGIIYSKTIGPGISVSINL